MKNLCVWLLAPEGGQEGAAGNSPAQLSSAGIAGTCPYWAGLYGLAP